VTQPYNLHPFLVPSKAACGIVSWWVGASMRGSWTLHSLDFCPRCPATWVSQALSCFLLKRAGIGRGTATWHLWTISMATTGQAFDSGHCLGVVLPHVLFFFSVMSSLLYVFPHFHLHLAKLSSLATVFLWCLAEFSLRSLKYETVCTSAQQTT
jgi:hypothetical protein